MLQVKSVLHTEYNKLSPCSPTLVEAALSKGVNVTVRIRPRVPVSSECNVNWETA